MRIMINSLSGIQFVSPLQIRSRQFRSGERSYSESTEVDRKTIKNHVRTENAQQSRTSNHLDISRPSYIKSSAVLNLTFIMMILRHQNNAKLFLSCYLFFLVLLILLLVRHLTFACWFSIYRALSLVLFNIHSNLIKLGEADTLILILQIKIQVWRGNWKSPLPN